MAKKTDKTNAARLLDKAGIAYNLIPYEFDENDLAAQHVADSLGQDIARVFKTLVLNGDKTKHIVCVVPGNTEVDLKALAKVSGNKKSGNDSNEGSSASYRLHTRRLFSDWNEEAFPDVLSQHGASI